MTERRVYVQGVDQTHAVGRLMGVASEAQNHHEDKRAPRQRTSFTEKDRSNPALQSCRGVDPLMVARFIRIS